MKIFGICICILLPTVYFVFVIYKFKIYKKELDKIKKHKNTKGRILLYIFDILIIIGRFATAIYITFDCINSIIKIINLDL